MGIAVATSADIPELVELLCVLFAQEADFTPDRPRQTRGVSMIVEDPAVGDILVWREDGAIEAMVNLLWTVSTAEGARAAILEDMVVHPRARDRGLGGRLLEGAIAHCRAAGCARITLLTDADNVGAIRFYGRRGFTRSAMVPLRLSLR
ncbi:MAG: GNAT family N-acetyltransferase [Gammaproteobacteria bacterium]|nr:GNAT family N-acetyltransferase [Gammaproteobacteria bacterium]MBI5616984.1 GNAT family N-acetyltransferase [Gammaproteobacteria bacterium]